MKNDFSAIAGQYESIREALNSQKYEVALEGCLEFLRVAHDPQIETLTKMLRNLIKDEKLNENIRSFQAVYAQANSLREAVLQPEIIIPCYNQGRFLGDALASLPSGVPVTVIDDASTDDTAEHIFRLKAMYSFKILTNPVNLNQSGSINRGVEESDGNLFIIVNADDALVRYAVPTILTVMQRYEMVRMVGGGSCLFDNSAALAKNGNLPTVLPYIPEPRLFFPTDAQNFRQPNDLNMTMSGSAFLRSAWEAVGGFWEFDRRVCSFDDRDFQMRVCSLFAVAVLREPLAFYRVNSSVGRGRCI